MQAAIKASLRKRKVIPGGGEVELKINGINTNLNLKKTE